MKLRLNTWKYALVAGSCLAAGYFALPNPTSQDAAYSAFGTLSVVCILVGIHLHDPEDRLSWYFLATAGAMFTLGDDVQNYYDIVLRASVPFPSIADALYLAGYPFLFAGVLRLTRGARRSSRREDIIDAAIISMGALAISWHFLMSSYVRDGSLTTFGMLVTLAYPIMDIGLLFIVFSALLFGSSKRPYHKLIAVALLVMFVADFTYDLLVLHNSYSTGNIVNGLFLIEYVLIAVAALHPSMAGDRPSSHTSDTLDTLDTSTVRQAANRRQRMPIVVLAGFIPPAILVVTSILGISVNVPVAAGFCLGVFALVYIRMMWMIDRIQRQSLEIGQHVQDLELSHRRRDQLEADLRHLAFHDELTGLANRALLQDRLDYALSSATRSGKLVAVCFGDLDGFKTVNDTLGHDVGDSVLVKTGTVLESIVRPGDTVARFGGDEFAILLVDIESLEAAIDFGRRIVSVFHESTEFEGNQAGLSISVGVALADSTRTAEELISDADAAMYEAKANGKNRVEVFEPQMRSRLLRRLELIGGFRGSLERSEFSLDYQPIYSLADGHLQSFEALVRWRHPTRGLVAPLDFIPVAEETGFIVPLGRWILVEACSQLGSLSSISPEPLSVAVNVSRRQMAATDLVDDIRTTISLTGISADQLILEITESVLMDDPEQAAAALSEIRALGVRIALDDFGTGYSPLSDLQDFPVDQLKIDRSFIDSLNRSEPGSSALVEAIVGLAHSLDLTVVAEGIEREDQLDRLTEFGCDYAQGYLMSRPVDGDALEVLIEALEGSSSPP